MLRNTFTERHIETYNIASKRERENVWCKRPSSARLENSICEYILTSN
jgi:hypothetical protein